MNQTVLIGRVGRTPELSKTKTGTSVCSFSLAVNRPHVKGTTDWIKCVAWRQSAEYLCKYAGKGSLVGVVGVLTASKYENKDGVPVTTYEVICDNVEILDKREQSADYAAQKAEDASILDGAEVLTDDESLPF